MRTQEDAKEASKLRSLPGLHRNPPASPIPIPIPQSLASCLEEGNGTITKLGIRKHTFNLG